MTVIRSEYSSVEELMEPYDGAEPLMILFTVVMPPGVAWYCPVNRCDHVKYTASFLTRPPDHHGMAMMAGYWTIVT